MIACADSERIKISVIFTKIIMSVVWMWALQKVMYSGCVHYIEINDS